MTLEPIIDFAHNIIKNHVSIGNTVLDMTAGNGHDTVFLAKLVGESGRVFAFDIQENALHNTKEKIMKSGLSGENVALIQDCHSRFLAHLSAEEIAEVKAVVFNLGYLPGGDKTICTHENTTVLALEQLLENLCAGALLVLVCYPGHPEGERECGYVLDWARKVAPERAKVVRYENINRKNPAPFVLAIELK